MKTRTYDPDKDGKFPTNHQRMDGAFDGADPVVATNEDGEWYAYQKVDTVYFVEQKTRSKAYQAACDAIQADVEKARAVQAVKDVLVAKVKSGAKLTADEQRQALVIALGG